jgi:hypothetical protein
VWIFEAAGKKKKNRKKKKKSSPRAESTALGEGGAQHCAVALLR